MNNYTLDFLFAFFLNYLQFTYSLTIQSQNKYQDLNTINFVEDDDGDPKFLGDGGSAKVFQCVYNGEPAVMKVFSGSTVKQKQTRMKREILAVINLQNSAHVLHMLAHTDIPDFGSLNWPSQQIKLFNKAVTHAIIYPLAPGGNLLEPFPDAANRAEVKLLLRLNLEDIVRQLVAGVAAIHAKNYVHRDIKLQNILIMQAQPLVVVISDLGCADRAGCALGKRKLDSHGLVDVYHTTASKVAPELYIDGVNHFDQPADMFSLGLTVFDFCLHLFDEWKSEDDQILLWNQGFITEIEKLKEFQIASKERRYDVLDKFIHERISILDSIPNLPAQVRDIIKHTLKANPKQRATAQGLVNMINGERSEEESTGRCCIPACTVM